MEGSVASAPRLQREGYPYVQRVPTRWMDNDVYGHVNNVVYYSYFDTVINTWLIEHAGLDPLARGETAGPIGLCAESHCRFLGPLAFPSVIEAGLRVEKLGRSSVRYGLGLFAAGVAQIAAEGWFVHVFVNPATRKPEPIGPSMREALQTLIMK